MPITEKILAGIKQAITEGTKVTIDLIEASSLTGSGTGKGGRTYFDDAFDALRYANPFRAWARVTKISGSDALFVAKTGNATDPTNPWGYDFAVNTGIPATDTSIWQLPVRSIAARLPIRSAVLDDVNNLDPSIVDDIALEFSTVEAASMAANNDQAGSATTVTGATSGLRGLDMYTSGAAAYGTSGTVITNGIHSIVTVTKSATLAYNDIVDITNALPTQYWNIPGTAWHIKPSMMDSLRSLKDAQGLPLFLEVGESDGGAVSRMFGFPVVPNPYLTDAFPIYLANWPRFMTICDSDEISIQMMEQTAPGFVTLFAEKCVVSTVRDPFAGVRMAV